MAQDAQLISQAGQVESLASDGLVSVSTGAGQPQKNMELAKFADSLGSSVPLQQTSEQVSITGLYARTSDGKMVELTKESVASVMGNLLYGATNARGLASVVAGFTSNIGNKLNGIKITDLDTLRTAGIYTFSSASDITVGFPPISDKSLMMLVTVTSYKGTANTLEYMQTAICGGVTYCREFYSNSWKGWKNLSNFGYNTLAELSSGVAQQMGYIGKKSYSLESGQEIGTGFTGAGAYVIFNASAGRSSLVVAGAIVLDAAAILYNDADISQSLSASGKVCFNRKAVNGEFFLKNNHTTSLNITIVPL